MKQINVVMSGFAPYEGIDINPCLEVLRALERDGIDALSEHDESFADVQVQIHTVMLPVSFAKAWPMLLETIDRTHPDIVIATGLKRAARGMQLERCATNLMDAAKPDADNRRPRRMPIDPQGPAAYWTRLPLRSILKAFAGHGIAATLSSDAGTYVCNSLFYNLLNWAVTRDHVIGGFLNFPTVNEQPHPQHGLPLAQQIAAARDVVHETVRYYLQPSSGEMLLG
ncbi:pyroglutamyl-peptidase I [Bifidobacterium boum]|uniref:Pyroglutamyl-peptidase I n=1 Tax=Bifidobacterium boum TaxID=78343 RepID=A0A086ZIX7_9BIFI|nr:pyroglutamyl-peptidase I [Bifidobacterium boum]KFJ07996.1 Pcp Pyrrolidone-carboxylate peptidase [Bifidobacterium thermophilum]MDO5684615.1 pyroglutamyl-peptidase I [Bifidobacterium sp.]KFI46477.1 pyrolidone-carboxylate peptidase [Bifidobacterium boum]MCF2561876.1 pyroglutamyl-peptidase I [Bifidobacterium boum]MCI5861289.1 pyroglutamyl-peptidase I [Bifidobacterium boum]